MRILIAATAFLTLVASAATAAEIKFNTSKGWNTGSYIYTNGSESVKAEAFHYSDSLPPTLGGNPYLASWTGMYGGIGICSGYPGSGTGGCANDQHTVDGANNNEVVILDFGSLVVKLTSITFAYADSDDFFDVLAFGNGTDAAATDGGLNKSVSCGASVCTKTNFSIETGSIFGIGAFRDRSEWKLQAITFDIIPTTEVPLPAAGWMLLAGLGGLAAAKRRKG